MLSSVREGWQREPDLEPEMSAEPQPVREVFDQRLQNRIVCTEYDRFSSKRGTYELSNAAYNALVRFRFDVSVQTLWKRCWKFHKCSLGCAYEMSMKSLS